MPRLTRFGLCFASLAAMVLLAVSVRKPGADPLSASRPLADWDFAELAAFLKRMGVEVRLLAVSKDGPLNHAAYLTTTAKEWRDMNTLNKDPKRIREWHRTVYCERIDEAAVTDVSEQWGDRCLAVGPFLFYGDAELLERVRKALASTATPTTP